jgi:hypothetical protein
MPCLARRMSSVLVESISGKISTLKLGHCGTTACQMSSAGQRCGDEGALMSLQDRPVQLNLRAIRPLSFWQPSTLF